MKPKIFISYCATDKALAQRLKADLDCAGCESWQFDLSATPGTDAWNTILERIENSDYVVVILSTQATASRAVQEEIAHAHYCSVNHPERLPRIVPLITEEGTVVPRQIVRAVRLRFREAEYGNDLQRLLSAIGMESPFASATELDVSFSASREFDVEREAALYASGLIRNNRDVAGMFESLCAAASAATAGGRWLTPSARPIVWEDSICRESRQPQFVRTYQSSIIVVFLLHSKHSRGYETSDRIIVEIKAFGEHRYDYANGDSDLVFNKDTLRLTFAGFRQLRASPITPT